MQKQAFIQSETFLIFAISLFSVCFLLYGVSTLSISYYEAQIFYNSNSVSGILSRFFVSIFGQNDCALRLPFIICHVVSIVLLYKVSKSILKRKFDRVVSVLLFVLLPGVIASAILVNDAGVVIMLALLNVYLYQVRKIQAFYLVLIVLAFVSDAFLVYFLALFIFGIYRRDAKLAWLSALLFALCFSIYGFESGGKPRGYFLDTISVFAAVFSPFLFIYFVYCIYRIWVREQKTLLWFIAVTSLCFCLVVSIRQKLELEDFLPFCVIATPLMIRVFFNSYRVRLPIFRRTYKFATSFVLISLALSFIFVAFNGILYKFIENPQKHFAYKYHVAKELAEELRKNNIYSIAINDEKMALRLKFYGIDVGDRQLAKTKTNKEDAELIIEKFGVVIDKFYIKNL